MATPIPCDWDGCDALAAILISDIANGDGYGWCGPHYLDNCRMIVRSVDDAAATAEADAADDAAVARIDAMSRATDPTASAPSSGEAPAAGDGRGGRARRASVATGPDDDDPDPDDPDPDDPDPDAAATEAPALAG